jgi:hypothetical protein
MSIQPIITIARAARMSGISIFTMRRLVRSGRCASVHVAEVGRVRLSAVMSCRRELRLAKRTSPICPTGLSHSSDPRTTMKYNDQRLDVAGNLARLLADDN